MPNLTGFFFLLEIMAIRSYNSITGEVADQAATEIQSENIFGSDLKKKIHGKILYSIYEISV